MIEIFQDWRNGMYTAWLSNESGIYSSGRGHTPQEAITILKLQQRIKKKEIQHGQ